MVARGGVGGGWVVWFRYGVVSRIVSAAVDSVRNDILYISTPSAQPCSSEQVSSLIQADVTPQHSPMAREFMGNSRPWLRGIHGNSRRNPVLGPLPHEFGFSSEASIFLRKTQ